VTRKESDASLIKLPPHSETEGAACVPNPNTLVSSFRWSLAESTESKCIDTSYLRSKDMTKKNIEDSKHILAECQKVQIIIKYSRRNSFFPYDEKEIFSKIPHWSEEMPHRINNGCNNTERSQKFKNASTNKME